MHEKLMLERKRKRTYAKELSEILGLKYPASYLKKESGEVGITIEEGILLAKYFGTTLDGLFWETETG